MGLGKEYRRVTQQTVLVTQLGLTMAGCVAFCFAVGYYLDKYLNTKGIFLVIFIILGIIGGGYTVYNQIMDTIAKDDSSQPDPKEHFKK